MGIYDRDYVREEPKGFFLGGSRSVTVNLVLANVCLFLVDVFTDGALSDRLALQPSLWQRPWQAYQLLTYGFMHDRHGVGHIAFNMLALWFFGRDVEVVYGPRLFLRFYLSVVVLSGLSWVVAEYVQNPAASGPPVVGASGAVMGVLLVFVLHYPMRLIYFWGLIPVPAWVLAALYVAQDFLEFRRSLVGPGDPTQGDMIAHSAHLAGAAFGAVFYKTRWTLFNWIPDKPFQRKWRLGMGPKLKVHAPDAEDDRHGERLDEILEKITREGEASLTKAERRFLEDASRRLQKRRT